MIRFEHPTIGILVLDCDHEVMSFEDSGPEAREVSYPNPSADGETDETAYAGNRAITLSLQIPQAAAETRSERWDRISRYRHPGTRFTLVSDLECEDGVERQIAVRVRSATRSVSDPFVATHVMALKSTEPFYRSLASQSVEVEPGLADEPGFTFPISFPLSFGGSASEGSGRVDATSDGTAPATLVTRIYGPCVGPSVRNLTTGGRLDFPTLTIDDGDHLELDSSARTARLNGLATANRLHLLDFATRVWFGLEPGVNELRFVVDSGSGHAEFVWQDHYL